MLEADAVGTTMSPSSFDRVLELAQSGLQTSLGIGHPEVHNLGQT
jgi:hypothetical protein